MRGDSDSAVARFTEALPLFRQVGNRTGEVHTLHNMAESELDRGNVDSALTFALSAVQLEESGAPDTRNLAQALYRLGLVRLAEGELAAAEESFLRAVRIVKEKADMIGLAYALLGLGETRLAQGDIQLAEATLTDALEIADDCRSRLVAGRVGLVLGEVNRRLGRNQEARAILHTARERFAVVGAAGWEQRAEEALGTLVG
jgi:tetratricopeptide (TPR) repeat protein